MAKKLKMITVMGKFVKGEPDNRVAFWERDIAHPDGEAFVVNDGKTYEVAETAGVKAQLGAGMLVTGEEMETQRVNWNSRLEERTPPPARRPGAPELRPATEEEEAAARPPLRGETEKRTARVPRLPEA